MRHPLIVASILILAAVPAAGQQILVTEVGAGPTGLPANTANVAYPGALHHDASGGLLIMTDQRLLQVDGSGTLKVVAGEGVNCTSAPYGDGGPAFYSCLTAMSGLTRESGKGVTRDAAGRIYISDTGHHVIRRIDTSTGIISRWAGSYSGSFSGDGGPALGASLYRPHQITFDAAGNLFVADRGNHRIRKISAAGIITTVAGNGTATASIDGESGNPADDLGDGLPATQASLKLPWGVAVDAAGNIYIGDSANHRVRKVNAATGIISTIAGNGTFGFSGENVPGTAATLAGPAGLSIDAGGNLLIADSQTDLYNVPSEDDQLNHHVRRLNLATGIISTVAGTEGFGYSGPNGDGGPATSAALYRPAHAISDGDGNIYIADQWHLRVRKVTAATGIISNFAGNETACFAGDGYPGKSARLCGPGTLRYDSAGNLYIADQYNGRVRRVDAATAVITTVAGNGSGTTSGDGGPAAQAGLDWPGGIALDSTGANLYIADYDAHRVRKVNMATGIITTVAGNGTPGFGGDGGQAKQALLRSPAAVALNIAGDLFIADSEDNRVRKVSAATGIITTVAGTGWAYLEYDGPGGSPIDEINDGGPATGASVSYPMDILVDSAGNLLIADWENRLRKVSPSGTITTIAGNGVRGNAGDGAAATSATVSPEQLAFDAAGNLFLTSIRRIRRIDATSGIISTVLGNDSNLFVPDGAAPGTASIVQPWGVAVDGSGGVHYSEAATYRIRALSPSPGSAVVPDGSAAGETPLTVTRAANGDLTLTWGPSCMSTDYDYAVYEGTLGSFPSHVPRYCSTDGARVKTFTPAAGSAYYLVVPRNGAEEGSYGLASNGAQTAASASACAPQHISAACQ